MTGKAIAGGTWAVTEPDVPVAGFDSFATPVARATTIPFTGPEAYSRRQELGPQGYSYGLYGTPTTRVLETKFAALHGAEWAHLVPSGQAALALSALALLPAGSTILIPDTCYPPLRDLAVTDLPRMGFEARFYDPLDLDLLAEALDPSVALVWIESPGSTTMEVQDVPAITRLARARGILTGCDNTWATGLLCRPLDLGGDLVTEALTKYPGGHSDVFMGTVAGRRAEIGARINGFLRRLGIGASPDDASLVLRGMQTMALRLSHSAGVAYRLARRAERSPVIASVLHPALPGHPGHTVFARDFSGASGVFSLVPTTAAKPGLANAFETLRHFAQGASWGGTRSLLVPMPVSRFRSVTRWEVGEPVLRLSIGLEDETDLTADFDRFLAALEAVAMPANAEQVPA